MQTIDIEKTQQAWTNLNQILFIPRNLIIKYDPTGDILYINKCAPYPEQESEELGDDIIVRVNPQTEEIENLEILFFSQRLQENNELQLPLIANLRLAG